MWKINNITTRYEKKTRMEPTKNAPTYLYVNYDRIKEVLTITKIFSQVTYTEQYFESYFKITNKYG